MISILNTFCCIIYIYISHQFIIPKPYSPLQTRVIPPALPDSLLTSRTSSTCELHLSTTWSFNCSDSSLKKTQVCSLNMCKTLYSQRRMLIEMLSGKILSGELVLRINNTFLISGLFCLQYSYSFSDAN